MISAAYNQADPAAPETEPLSTLFKLAALLAKNGWSYIKTPPPFLLPRRCGLLNANGWSA